MEKFSKWRDPSTGLQPFLPIQAPTSSPAVLALAPFSFLFGVARGLILLLLGLVYFLLVQLLLTPLGAVGRPLASLLTTILARAALGVLGYYWIRVENVSPKRGAKGVKQAVPSVKRGDLIIANWTSPLDVLYYAFRYNPTFLLPVFSSPALVDSAFGRSSGTGSASILPPSSDSRCIGYVAVSPLSLILRSGGLPPTRADVEGQTVYPTLAAARRAAPGSVVLFPEATTSNGRAVLRFGEGVIAEEVGKDGMVWVKYIRHAAPTALVPGAAVSVPGPRSLLRLLSGLPLPREMAVRTLHPSAAPSSPSFLPSEIIAAQPAGLGSVKADAAWRDACAVVLAETGRVRRVPGMGWVEKASFLAYYNSKKRR